MSIQPLQTWWRSPNFLFGAVLPSTLVVFVWLWATGFTWVVVSAKILPLIHYPEFVPTWMVVASNVLLSGIPTLGVLCLAVQQGIKTFDTRSKKPAEVK